MIQSFVIEVSAASAADCQTAINNALAAAPGGGIEAAKYLESLVIAYKENNQTALIVIWYDDGA